MNQQTALGHTHLVAKTLTVWSWTRVSQGTRSSNATTGMRSQDLRRRKSQRRGLVLSPNPHPRVKKPVPRHFNMHVNEWPPLPTRSGPSTAKRTRDSNPQVSAPWTWSKPVDPFPNSFSTNQPGNGPAAWSTPSLGGNQTTWEAMIRSDPSQKLNLAMELVKMISQL